MYDAIFEQDYALGTAKTFQRSGQIVPLTVIRELHSILKVLEAPMGKCFLKTVSYILSIYDTIKLH